MSINVNDLKCYFSKKCLEEWNKIAEHGYSRENTGSDAVKALDYMQELNVCKIIIFFIFA